MLSVSNVMPISYTQQQQPIAQNISSSPSTTGSESPTVLVKRKRRSPRFVSLKTTKITRADKSLDNLRTLAGLCDKAPYSPSKKLANNNDQFDVIVPGNVIIKDLQNSKKTSSRTSTTTTKKSSTRKRESHKKNSAPKPKSISTARFRELNFTLNAQPAKRRRTGKASLSINASNFQKFTLVTTGIPGFKIDDIATIVSKPSNTVEDILAVQAQLWGEFQNSF